ncbi:EAL domain-containing protein [Acidiferrimicrobium sp. IK]|uniref:putative bifunctional diguanylate cyclase/phosphodiesterase n=1 Tax=Acidiferrimicrobium sp. IK TaxID=2871700 RepID=UPI0021CB6808|nr:EAL domain-containing protein [Acidiferrimicrobium sp. IK]MCU4187055.1 EAL domain-containing protein [Acidiferrimicrobium sp. IK]
MPQSARGPGDGRHRSIRTLLVALVSVPLIAVTLLAGARVQSAGQQASTDLRTMRTIQMLAAVNAARSASLNLYLPVMATGIGQNAGLTPGFHVPASTQALVTAGFPPSALETKAVPAFHAFETLDLRGATPQLTAATKQAEATLRTAVRAATVGDASLVPTAGVLLRALRAMGQAELAVANQLAAGDIHNDERQAVQQLDITVDLDAAAGVETPAYMASVVGANRADWPTTWVAYAGAVERAASLRGDLARTFQAIENSKSEQAYDALVDPTVSHSATSITTLLNVAEADGARNTAMGALLKQASGEAVAIAVHDRDADVALLWLAVVEAGVVILVSLGVAFLVSRTITRPVRRLAAAAQQISEGNLVEVVAEGPAEVRTAGAALGLAAASLRRVEAQASDLAAGDLTSERLGEPLPGRLGEMMHASVGRIIDTIHEREALQTRLAHQAAHDPLTGLPNRAAALARLDEGLARAARTGQAVGLLFVDLDGFKSVNDSYGHSAGDEVLNAVSRRMQAEVRAGDVVCRLGGDEFVVVVEPAGAEADIVALAERLISTLEQPIDVAGNQVHLGASIGITFATEPGTTAETLLGEADAAVYRAKAAGRGTVEVFDVALRESLQAKSELEEAIRHGLVNGEFSLDYQPVIRVETGEIQSYEALVRWDRPGHGRLMPSEFVPVAEQSSLIIDLGRWVLLEAVSQIARWNRNADHGERVSVAVNVSGRQLNTPQLLEDVEAALATEGIDPPQLILELTETVMVTGATAARRLQALKRLGVRIALDDFGSGYTSIAQLGTFPIDILKIDQCYISTISESNQLVELIITMAHTFGFEVAAEGVEDPSQLESLRALHCDHAQGFLFSRPVPAGEHPPQLAGVSLARS